MTIFDDRGRAQEAKFVLDAELRFKADARRNRLLAEWAAGVLGKAGKDAEEYIEIARKTDMGHPSEEQVFRKLAADLEGLVDAAGVHAKIHELGLEAYRQILAESK